MFLLERGLVESPFPSIQMFEGVSKDDLNYHMLVYHRPAKTAVLRNQRIGQGGEDGAIGAGYGEPGGQLPGEGQPKSGDEEVNLPSDISNALLTTDPSFDKKAGVPFKEVPAHVATPSLFDDAEKDVFKLLQHRPLGLFSSSTG